MSKAKIAAIVDAMRTLETELENLDADGNPQPCECCREEMERLQREIATSNRVIEDLTREKYEAVSDAEQFRNVIIRCRELLGADGAEKLTEAATRVMEQLSTVTQQRAEATDALIRLRLEIRAADYAETDAMIKPNRTIAEQAAKIDRQRAEIARLHATSYGALAARVEALERAGVKP